jgi:DNA/RNA endonuclease YhcR with UshA esterase domain
VIVPIGDLHIGYADQEVTVAGQVIATASFARGFKFTLDDGSGQVVLLMWHSTYDDCWDAPQLNVGATVQATGRVGQFEGELQIEPNLGSDVKVTAPGGPFAPQQQIGDLSAHLEQQVTITGQISRIEGTSNGAKLFVVDDSGEILVFLWNSILERVPNNQALGTPGTHVRIVGLVQVYRSNLEIVPVLPYDVEALQ